MRIDEEQLDYNLVSPSDFTVQLTGLPPSYTQEDIRNLLNSWWDGQTTQTQARVGQFFIEKICIAYDVRDYLTKMNQRNQINLQLRKNDFYEKQFQKYPDGQNKSDLLAKKRQVQKEIDDLEKLVFDGTYNKTTPQCFVTFNTRKVLDSLLDSQSQSQLQKLWMNFKKIFCCSDQFDVLTMKYQGDIYIINAYRAPEPSDITWENCGATNAQKFSKRLFTWFCTLILLGICFILIYLINLWQDKVNKDNKGKLDNKAVQAALILLSLFSSFSIVFINMALTIALRILSTQTNIPSHLTFNIINLELQSTVTQLNISVASKLVIAQFCNSALITLVVNYFINKDLLWSTGGITNDFTLIALSNCIIPPLLNFLNPWHLIRILKRRSIRNDKNGLFSQGEANNWFEGGPLDIAVKYASCIKTLWMIGFYTPLSPYLPCFGIITIFFSYWMDKYILLNRQARPNLLGSDLNKEMIEWAEYFPFSIAIGNLVWMKILDINDKDSNILIFVAIGLSAINFIIPSEKLNKMIFKIKELDDSEQTGTYKNKKYTFLTEYDRCNPITKEEAIKSYVKELKEQGKNDAANAFLIREQANNNITKNFAKNIASFQTSIITSALNAPGKFQFQAQTNTQQFQNNSPQYYPGQQQQNQNQISSFQNQQPQPIQDNSPQQNQNSNHKILQDQNQQNKNNQPEYDQYNNQPYQGQNQYSQIGVQDPKTQLEAIQNPMFGQQNEQNNMINTQNFGVVGAFPPQPPVQQPYYQPSQPSVYQPNQQQYPQYQQPQNFNQYGNQPQYYPSNQYGNQPNMQGGSNYYNPQYPQQYAQQYQNNPQRSIY